MRNVGRMIAAAMIIMTIPSLSRGDIGKITVDPNTPGSIGAEASNTDKRLAQKITYDSGYQRLWQVIDDIQLKGSVPLKSGRNKQDWRVRDLPIVVCANDVPLGKLLRSIADTTHLEFATSRVGDRALDDISYRIWFSDKLQREE